jgi:cytochrome c-type biogenesis protein CcmH/NrfG
MPILDEAYYLSLGRAVADGFWLGERGVFFMDPMYGYFIGFLFWIFGDDPNVIRFAQIVLDGFNVYLIYRLGARLAGPWAGWIGGLLYAVSGVAIFYTLLILKTTLSVTWILLFLHALFACLSSTRLLSCLGLGLLAGILTLFRGNFVLFAPLILLGWIGIERYGVREAARKGLALGFGLLLVLGIGGIRNHAAGKEFILLTSQSGRLLYACNNPDNLTGRYNVPPFSRPHPEDSERDFHREAERRTGRRMTVKEVSSFWMMETFRFLRENPGALPILVKNKLQGTVGNYEIPNVHSFEVAVPFSKIISFPVPNFALFLALGLPGLVIGVLRDRRVGWLFLPVIVVLATVLVYYTSSRFRFPLLPVFGIGAGIGIRAVADWIRKGNWKPLLPTALAALLLSGLSVSSSRPLDTGTDAYYLAKAYWNRNELGPARTIAAEAAERFPDQSRFPVLLGMIALAEGDTEVAARNNLWAIELDPNNPDARHNLGLAYLMEGRGRETILHVGRAYSLDPNPRYLLTLGRAYDQVGDTDRARWYYARFLKQTPPGDPLRDQAKQRLDLLPTP